MTYSQIQLLLLTVIAYRSVIAVVILMTLFTINNPAVLKLAFSSDTLSTNTLPIYTQKVGSGARDNGTGLSPNIIYCV